MQLGLNDCDTILTDIGSVECVSFDSGAKVKVPIVDLQLSYATHESFVSSETSLDHGDIGRSAQVQIIPKGDT